MWNSFGSPYSCNTSTYKEDRIETAVKFILWKIICNLFIWTFYEQKLLKQSHRNKFKLF